MAAPPSISAMSPQKPGEFSPAIDKRHWVPDQRDAFIGWLRGEFAAANAIIDALCQHLQLNGAPGEYDFVLGSIQQRRFSWNGVLHMQQYFSVAEVLFSLQQVIMRKQQQQHQQQLLPNGNGKPSQQKAYTQNGNHGGDSRARRDFSVNARKQPERPKARNVPVASANENGRKEGEYRGGSKVAGSLGEENFANASPAPVPQQQDKLPGHPQQNCNRIVEETSKHAESSVELGRLKAAEVATVEVVETGQRKVNVAEGQLYNHVFGESRRAELTEILERTPGDQSCIKGKLKTSAAEGNESQLQECVQSMVDHLSGQGILSGDVRPNYYTLHVIKEGKSVAFEDQVQPLYLVSLLAEPSLVLGKRGTNVLKGAPSLSIPAGSLLKFEASNTTNVNAVSYAVNVDTSKRILILLGQCEQEERSSGLTSTAKPKPSSSSSSGSSKKPQPSSTNCGRSTSPAAAGSSCSSLQAWQARPGTGVYIPNSNSSKCDIAMSYRACIQT